MSGAVVDPRADLYALGCVAYWLVTGKLVFEGDNALRMMIQHLQAQPVPPSRRANRPIPASLETVILSCLEKNPAKRPESAEALSARLAACDLEERWSADEAHAWWTANLPDTPSGEVAAAPATPHSPLDSFSRVGSVAGGGSTGP